MKIILTGFGAFGSIADNPSRRVAERAAGLLSAAGVSCEFRGLEAAMAAVDEFYESIPEGSDVFVIHIGVYDALKRPRVEVVGKNVADFCIPDARGAQRGHHAGHADTGRAGDRDRRAEAPGARAAAQ